MSTKSLVNFNNAMDQQNLLIPEVCEVIQLAASGFLAIIHNTSANTYSVIRFPNPQDMTVHVDVPLSTYDDAFSFYLISIAATYHINKLTK